MSRTVPSMTQETPETSRSSCYTVCVPRRWRAAPAWRVLLGEFSGLVWALMAATFAAARFSLTFVLSMAARRAQQQPDEAASTARRQRPSLHRRDVGFHLVASMFGSVQPTTPGHGRATNVRAVEFQRLLPVPYDIFATKSTLSPKK